MEKKEKSGTPTSMQSRIWVKVDWGTVVVVVVGCVGIGTTSKVSTQMSAEESK